MTSSTKSKLYLCLYMTVHPLIWPFHPIIVTPNHVFGHSGLASTIDPVFLFLRRPCRTNMCIVDLDSKYRLATTPSR